MVRRDAATPNPGSIRPVIYRNPHRPELDLEVLAIGELRRKAPAGYLARPQRPRFHQLLLPTEGRCTHEVDFQRVPLGPGALVWVRPGQVQRFDLDSTVEGWLVLFTAEFVEAEAETGFEQPIGPRIELGKAAEDVAWLVERLRRAAEDFAADLASTRRLLHHLLHALLIVVSRCANAGEAQAAPSTARVFSLFRTEVERRLAETRRVRDYARIIGYSAKTLSRAAQAATGLSAKAYIDQRVLLESKRLLAHTDVGTAQIASSLGFSEATNFIKFFRRAARQTPSEFRTRSRSRRKRRSSLRG